MVDRIATVETEVTKQLKTTLQLLQELTTKQDKHKEGLDKLDEGQHVLEEKFGTMSVQYKDLVERVEKLESKGFQGGLSAQSTTTTEPDGLGGKRVPALIVGGWNDDTPAGEAIEKATRALQQLQVDLDYRNMFVPGVRRGFGLIPLKGAREGENAEDYRQRIQGAVTKIRNAKLQTAHPRGHGPTPLHVPRGLAASRAKTPGQACGQGQTMRIGARRGARALRRSLVPGASRILSLDAHERRSRGSWRRMGGCRADG
ncbi:gnt1 [Symbiodinium natans]|uniref:Gnt1 protein n=1 Tax=Symbiodinium natans TaxID=878477 RepID=A0A812SM41_9DINO|nr:gnt1 [Symbiodinium natans]